MKNAMPLQYCFWVFLLCAATCQLLVADTKKISSPEIHIVTPSWKNFTEENGDGFYFDLVRMVYEPEGISLRYEIIPWARSELMVLNDQADALVGSYREKEEFYLYPTNPIWLDVSTAVFKRGQIEWNGISSLNEKSVGWIRGYRYDNYLDTKMNIQRLNNNKQGWAMLELDRLDVYIDSLTDIHLYMSEHKLDATQFELKNVIVERMYMRFSNTPKGALLARIYDTNILKLDRNGQLYDLYKKWGYAERYSKMAALLGDITEHRSSGASE